MIAAPLNPIRAALLGLIAGLAAGVIAAVAAWHDGHERAATAGAAELSAYRATVAEGQRQSAAAALKRLEAAQARGDALTLQLQQAEAQRLADNRGNADEIRRLTSGRACLSAGTVRLLNRGTARGADPHAGPVPPAASEPAAADGAAASDTDVALWADSARSQYDTCRGRLDALIDWETAHE